MTDLPPLPDPALSRADIVEMQVSLTSSPWSKIHDVGGCEALYTEEQLREAVASERAKWLSIAEHVANELEALDDETAQLQAKSLREWMK